MTILPSPTIATVRSSAEAIPNIVRTRIEHVRKRNEESVIVIMGATGTGKSKLSVDVATRFPAEIINADKIQLYRGLDITTNKIPAEERRGVPHHLLGEFDPSAGELTPGRFRVMGGDAVEEIAARGRIPVIAGGSNSYIYAMVAERYGERKRGNGGLRYRSCFVWVDVEKKVLEENLERRVEEMVGMGMVEELGRYFDREGAEAEQRHVGLGKAIGVPELREFFRRRTAAAYEEAVAEIKRNTRRLAEEQVRKIVRLGEMGWEIRRVDATEAVAARIAGGGREVVEEIWERDVVGPTVRTVERFLREVEEDGAADAMTT